MSDGVCLTLLFLHRFSKLSSFSHPYGHFLSSSSHILLLSACIRHFTSPPRSCHLHLTVRVSATPAMPSARAERTAASASTAWQCMCATTLSDVPGMKIKMIRGACVCGSTLTSPRIRNWEPQPYGPHTVGIFISLHPISEHAVQSFPSYTPCAWRFLSWGPRKCETRQDYVGMRP